MAGPSSSYEARVTPRQLQLLQAVERSQQSRCCSPTIGELAEGLGLSRSTVFEHLGELRRKHLLNASPSTARSLSLSRQGRRLLESLVGGEGQTTGGPSAEIPLVGCVAAGAPVEAVEDRSGLSLSSCFGTGDDLFALEVRGESMIEEDIRAGDYVVCRRTPYAENGQLVVASIGGEEATLKRLYKEPGAVRLQPANAGYQPIYTQDCRVEGVAIGLVRRL